MRRIDGQLISVLGVTRSGKTAWVRQQISKLPRVLIWDVKPDPAGSGSGEWGAFPEFQPVLSWHHLAGVLRAANGSVYSSTPGRYAYHPADASKASFQIFAAAAFRWIRAGDAIIVAEELPDVTGAGKAESAWGILTRQGLGLGATIYALSQRPAESDKTTLGNSSVVHVGRLGLRRDFDYAAELLRLDTSGPVRELKQLEYLERQADDRVISGKLGFRADGMAYRVGRAKIIKK